MAGKQARMAARWADRRLLCGGTAAASPPQPRERMLAVRGGLRLGARVWGDEDAAVSPERRWLALHGYLDNAATYDKFAPELIALGAASVVCMDFAGHGKSEWRRSGVYYVFDNVADVIYAADALKWDKFSLIGHSLGGGVAQGVAAACPERVMRVVSIEALSWWPQDSRQFVQNLRANITGASQLLWQLADHGAHVHHAGNRGTSAHTIRLLACI